MKTLQAIFLAAAALMLSLQAAAQADEAQIQRVQEVEIRKIQQREAEAERRMLDAERRMAEAARQIAELASERLPHVERFQQRFEFIGDDKPRLGVTIGGDDETGPVEGVPIIAVTPGSAAADAGLRAGDIITAINDESLSADSLDEASKRLLDFMSGVVEGDTLDVEYMRDDRVGKVEVQPKPVSPQVFAFGGDGMPLPSSPNIVIAPGDGPRSLAFQWVSNGWGDMELVELNAGLGKYFGTEEGLLVVNAPDAGALQLEDGDVIQRIDGRTPASVRHALRILGSYQAGESLKLDIMRDKKKRTLEVEIPDDRIGLLAPGMAPVAKPARAVPAPRPRLPTERT